eukprot:m.2293 g.2293  ORF g.2293 m.2293 type:complete len:325 (+) comp8549_c0_seq1:42-1016(+)
MFGGGYRGQKLRVNLKLSINRFKHLEKKKTENAVKARKEIADYLAQAKIERAKIRVEHIIREDYLVEAMEIIEMYCDLLLARFGLIETMKTCDEGLQESVCTLIWVTPRLSTDVAELRLVSEQLTLKYGKPFADMCRANKNGLVNEKVVERLSVKAPPRSLVENYLVAIGKTHGIDYDPDPEAFDDGLAPMLDENPVYSLEPKVPLSDPPPTYPAPGRPPYGGVPSSAPYPSQPVMPHPSDKASMAYPPGPNAGFTPYPPGPSGYVPGPSPGYRPPPGAGSSGLPPLPQVPTDSLPGAKSGGASGDNVDFDELTRRFEELKKKK